MTEQLRSLSVEQFMFANAPGKTSADKDLVNQVTDEAISLQRQGILKKTNYSIITPFVMMGGESDKFVDYFKKKHGINPLEWHDWPEILSELKNVFVDHFQDK